MMMTHETKIFLPSSHRIRIYWNQCDSSLVFSITHHISLLRGSNAFSLWPLFTDKRFTSHMFHQSGIKLFLRQSHGCDTKELPPTLLRRRILPHWTWKLFRSCR